MPTFDFSNVLRKIVSASVSAVCSPVIAVTAVSVTLGYFFDDILEFFGTSFNFPTISLPDIDLENSEDYIKILLYAVNFDAVVGFVNWVCDMVLDFFDFTVKSLISGLLVISGIGVYRVVRAQIKDLFG